MPIILLPSMVIAPLPAPHTQIPDPFDISSLFVTFISPALYPDEKENGVSDPSAMAVPELSMMVLLSIVMRGRSEEIGQKE